jgi:anti-anti-sigma factor
MIDARENGADGHARTACAGARRTHQQLDALLATRPHALMLELGRLDYISSAGIRSLFQARRVLGRQGGKLLAVNPQAQIREVLELVRAVPMNKVFATAEAADAYLDALQRQVLEGSALPQAPA